jgi:ABC-2 type transport system permease protein
MLHSPTGLAVVAGVVVARALVQRGLRARRPRERSRGDPGGPIRLVLHQARYDLLTLLRNRQARYAAVLLPLLLLVLVGGMFGHDRDYVPGLAALAVIASSFVNLVISVVGQRESGVLKRRRATPVPAWILIAGRTLTAATVSLGVTAVLVAAAGLAFDARIAAAAIPAVALTALAGSACFCVLGFAMTTVIGSAESAQPMLQALMLPLYFASGIFIPRADLPGWLSQVAALFPVERLADALHHAYGVALDWGDFAVMGLWAVAGLAVALRRFRWTPAAAGTA